MSKSDDPGRCTTEQREKIAALMKAAIPENFRMEQAAEVLRHSVDFQKAVLAVLQEGGRLPQPYKPSGW